MTYFPHRIWSKLIFSIKNHKANSIILKIVFRDRKTVSYLEIFIFGIVATCQVFIVGIQYMSVEWVNECLYIKGYT